MNYYHYKITLSDGITTSYEASDEFDTLHQCLLELPRFGYQVSDIVSVEYYGEL